MKNARFNSRYKRKTLVLSRIIIAKIIFSFVFYNSLSSQCENEKKSMRFDGFRDFVEIHHLPSHLQGDLQNFTVELWFLLPSSNQNTECDQNFRRIIAFGSDYNNNGIARNRFELGECGGELNLYMSKNPPGGSGLRATDFISPQEPDNISDSLWHCLTIIKDEDSLDIYLDCKLVLDESFFPNSFSWTDPNEQPNFNFLDMRIGDGTTNYILNPSLTLPGWDGLLDEFKFWSKSLSPTEICKSCPPILNDDGLEVYWDFGDGDLSIMPDGDNTSITTVLDKSGNNNDGVISSGLDGHVLNGLQGNFTCVPNGQGNKITFEPNPIFGFIPVDEMNIDNEYLIEKYGVSFHLDSLCGAPMKIAKVGLPRTAFEGPSNSSYIDGLYCNGVISTTRADMPQGTSVDYGCYFLTENNDVGPPVPKVFYMKYHHTPDFPNYSSFASGSLLDIVENGEEWTITAYSPCDSIIDSPLMDNPLVIAASGNTVDDGIGNTWAFNFNSSSEAIGWIEFRYTGTGNSGGFALDNIIPRTNCVTSSCAPPPTCDSTCLANFNWEVQDSCGAVAFIDLSSGQNLSYSWHFGDSNSSTSQNQNPTYIYSASGPYTVCLTISNESCTDMLCQQIDINVDNTPPVMLCVSDLTVDISNGTQSIDVSDVDLGSYDDCAIVNMWLDQTSFDCSDVCQETTVNLYAEDCCGNLNSCTTTVHVEEYSAPVISCPSDITITDLDDPFPPATGNPSATDVCDSNLDIDYSDKVVGECPQLTIERSWIAFDDCGNSDSCVQIILINCDTIQRICDPETNIVSNGHFGDNWAPTPSHNDIHHATDWGPIWVNDSNVEGTGDLWNSILTPAGFQSVLTSPTSISTGNYTGFWVSAWHREGVMNQLATSLQQNNSCYEMNFDVACLLDNGGAGNPVLDVYGCSTTGFGTGDASNISNLNLFPGNTVLLASYPIPLTTCTNQFTNVTLQFDGSLIPSSGINYIFFTRSDNTTGQGMYIGLDNVCLSEVDCPCVCPIESGSIDVNVNNCNINFNGYGFNPDCDEMSWELEYFKEFFPPDSEVVASGFGLPIEPVNYLVNQNGLYRLTVEIERVSSSGEVCKESYSEVVTVTGCTDCVCDIPIDHVAVSLTQDCKEITLTPSSLLTECDIINWDFGDGTGSYSAGPGPGSKVMHTYSKTGLYNVKYKIVRVTDSGNCYVTGNIPINVQCCPYDTDSENGIIQNGNFVSGAAQGVLGNGGTINNWESAFGSPLVQELDGCDDFVFTQIQTMNLENDGIRQRGIQFDQNTTYYFELCANQIGAQYNINDGFNQLPVISLIASSTDLDGTSCVDNCELIGSSSMILESGFIKIAFPGWKPESDFDQLTVAAGWRNGSDEASIDTVCLNDIIYQFELDNIKAYEVKDCEREVSFHGFDNTALGSACLKIVEDNEQQILEVTNIGDSGEAGIVVEFEDSYPAVNNSYFVQFAEPLEISDGSILECTSYGLYNGVFDHEILTARFTGKGSNKVNLHVSNELNGVDSFEITVLNKGELIKTFNVSSGDVGNLELPNVCFCYEEVEIEFEIRFEFSNGFTYEGSEGDEISIRPKLNGLSLGVTKLSIRGANLPDDKLRIISEGLDFFNATKTILKEELNYVVFPNPTSHELNIKFEDSLTDNVYIRVMDISGQEILNHVLISGEESLEIITNDWKPGIYIVLVHTNKGQTQSRKVVKTK